MPNPTVATVRQIEIDIGFGPMEALRALRAEHPTSLLLDGSGGFDEDVWSVGPLLAVRPRVSRIHGPGCTKRPLRSLQRELDLRRARGGEGETGLAVLLAYDLLEVEETGRACSGLPTMLVLAVDRSIRFVESGRPRMTVRAGEGAPPEEDLDRLHERLSTVVAAARPARRVGPARTSLPRERYLRAFEQVKRHIAAGDIYQANLSQQLRVRYDGDALELFAALAERTPAPRSVFLEAAGVGLASVSPETFVRVDPGGHIQTRPIKGTRPRGATPDEDRRAARELLASPKDRAELLMIVDLERNDLGRICRTGSVETRELARLHSFAAVHHLVATIEGRLRPGVDTEAMLRAIFPGGSITGAPKRRAMQILREIEPVGRNYFTGSLFWFGDDGSVDSSILIRSVVLDGERAYIGAGGGVVADSDSEEEWRESNHKARALTAALGFDPEEAR